MFIAAPMRANARPMRPSPTMPSVRPESSVIGATEKHHSPTPLQAPSRTASACGAVRRASSSISAAACCATESVP